MNYRVDFAIATGSEELFPHLVRILVYRWHRTVIVPRQHPLVDAGPLTLKKIAAYPIVTYVFSFSGRSSLADLFSSAGIVPDVSLTARDADVIKTYVRLGLGVGIVAKLAVDPIADADLVTLNADHLFDRHTTWIRFRRNSLLRPHMYEFIELLAPHASRKLIVAAEEAKTQKKADRLFHRIAIPLRDRA